MATLAARSLVNVQIVCGLPAIPLKTKKASIRNPTELLSNVQIVCGLPAIPLKKKKASIRKHGRKIDDCGARKRLKMDQTQLGTAEKEVSPSPSHPVCESLQLSRAGMLKRRFPDTILKAQKQTLSVRDGDRIDAAKALEKMEESAAATCDLRATTCDVRAPSHPVCESWKLSRAGMLKKRFPDTILKAQKPTLSVSDGDKIDSVKALEKMEESAATTTCDFRAPSHPVCESLRVREPILQAQKPTLSVCESLQHSRADMLKKRFADTILTTQKQALSVRDGDKIDTAKASMQSHQREREASRIALEKMEESAATTCDLRAPSHPVCESLQNSRADMLKKRFADTILKTQKQNLFVCDGDKIERLKLERQEALMQRRQREREASRIAIEKMDRSAAFEDTISILNELAHMMGDFSFAGPLAGSGSMYVNRKMWRPLERVGLYLKENDYDQEFVC